MKKEELKQIIKPLIKECLKEVLIEEGFSKMLSESARSSAQVPTINNIQSTKSKNNLQEISLNKQNQLQENKKKMLDSIGTAGFDPFAGSQPLKEDKEVIASDPGIDISKLLGENKQVWKQTLNALNGKKEKE
jgi:hypothetical protein